MDPQVFDHLWQQQREFQFAMPGGNDERCIYAQHFATWADTLYQEEVSGPTHIGINQKMLLLTKRFFEWRASVPKAHRDRISGRGHICIFHIFERTFHRLRVLELSLTPPMLFLPPPPPPPPAQVTKVYKFDSFPIGEVEDDEDDDA